MARIVLFFAASALLISGCLSDENAAPKDEARTPVKAAAPPVVWNDNRINNTLSQVRFALQDLIKEDLWHTTWDGVQLHSRVYRPGQAEDWKAPVILHMSPYFGRNSAANGPVPTNNLALDGWLVNHFVPRGYAVVLNDVRGTGESGGCLEQTGPRQTKDGFAVVEALAALPWANGKVGMIGISYDGETQQSTATAAPPHLTTIVPLASVAGQYEWNFYDGVPYTTNGIQGMVGYMAIGVQPPTIPPHNGAKPQNWVERWDCHPENLKEGADPRGDFNQYWKDREIRNWINGISNTSVLYVHGLEDWNVKPNHIRDWYNNISTPKHAWLGQWQHNYPDRNSFKREWSRQDWRLTVHRWFDHWLLDVDTGIMQEPPVQVMDSAGRWRYEDGWPPEHTTPDVFYLVEGLKLGRERGSAGAISYQDANLPFDAAQSTPGSSLTYLSEPLSSDLHYAGWPVLEFTATLNRPGTHFAVHLIDESSDGSRKIVNRAYLDAQHRNTLERSEPVPLNEAVKYRLRFFPQDDLIPAGHRLVLTIGARDGWIQPDGTAANVQLALGGERAPKLTLPVVDDTKGRFFTPPMAVPT